MPAFLSYRCSTDNDEPITQSGQVGEHSRTFGRERDSVRAYSAQATAERIDSADGQCTCTRGEGHDRGRGGGFVGSRTGDTQPHVIRALAAQCPVCPPIMMSFT